MDFFIDLHIHLHFYIIPFIWGLTSLSTYISGTYYSSVFISYCTTWLQIDLSAKYKYTAYRVLHIHDLISSNGCQNRTHNSAKPSVRLIHSLSLSVLMMEMTSDEQAKRRSAKRQSIKSISTRSSRKHCLSYISLHALIFDVDIKHTHRVQRVHFWQPNPLSSVLINIYNTISTPVSDLVVCCCLFMGIPAGVSKRLLIRVRFFFLQTYTIQELWNHKSRVRMKSQWIASSMIPQSGQC